MSPYSLNDPQFDHLDPEQYLEKIAVVADLSKPETERAKAKEDLLMAHFRLIASLIQRILKVIRANGEYRNLNRIGIEDRSDLFNSLAAHMYTQMTDMAVSATEGGFQLSSAITSRVTKRLIDKIRKSTAKKRTANFKDSELLETLSSSKEPFDALESLMLKEADQEIRAAIADLSGTQGLVLQALLYGLETGQDLSIAEVARILSLSPTTARSAFQAARKKLQERFSNDDSGGPQ